VCWCRHSPSCRYYALTQELGLKAGKSVAGASKPICGSVTSYLKRATAATSCKCPQLDLRLIASASKQTLDIHNADRGGLAGYGSEAETSTRQSAGHSQMQAKPHAVHIPHLQTQPPETLSERELILFSAHNTFLPLMETMDCLHVDVRSFDGLLTCLACGDTSFDLSASSQITNSPGYDLCVESYCRHTDSWDLIKAVPASLVARLNLKRSLRSARQNINHSMSRKTFKTSADIQIRRLTWLDLHICLSLKTIFICVKTPWRHLSVSVPITVSPFLRCSSGFQDVLSGTSSFAWLQALISRLLTPGTRSLHFSVSWSHERER
jgi:hypothetical protein